MRGFDSNRYIALDQNWQPYKAKFRNKETGEEVLGGLVYIVPNEGYNGMVDDCDAGEQYRMVFSHSKEATLLNSNDNPSGVDSFDHFSDDYDIMNDFEFPSESEDWEFVGFATQPSIVEKYAENPPKEELDELIGVTIAISDTSTKVERYAFRKRTDVTRVMAVSTTFSIIVSKFAIRSSRLSFREFIPVTSSSSSNSRRMTRAPAGRAAVGSCR